ncbi:MAG: hypothetical protein GF313_02930, partial [Caldithrix sp.]|nr:hypothetical protein [Caldithrix sp.]
MNYLKFFVIVPLLLLQSCLTYESIGFRVEFNENYSMGNIKITYHGLASTDSTMEKQRSDFNDLVEMIESDAVLLDYVEEGIYVKNIELFKEGDKLNAAVDGIFSNYGNNEMSLTIHKEEIVLMMVKDEDYRIESDGNMIETEDNLMITWPMGTRDLSWKMINLDEGK